MSVGSGDKHARPVTVLLPIVLIRVIWSAVLPCKACEPSLYILPHSSRNAGFQHLRYRSYHQVCDRSWLCIRQRFPEQPFPHRNWLVLVTHIAFCQGKSSYARRSKSIKKHSTSSRFFVEVVLPERTKVVKVAWVTVMIVIVVKVIWFTWKWTSQLEKMVLVKWEREDHSKIKHQKTRKSCPWRAAIEKAGR